MGDRVLYQIYTKNSAGEVTDFSPVIYSHWGGESAPGVIRRLRPFVVSRGPKVSDVTGALVLLVQQGDWRNASIWNAKHLLTAEDSHGDAGVVLLRLDDRELVAECICGYLKDPERYAELLKEPFNMKD